MHLEAIQPAEGRSTALRDADEHVVPANATVMADGKGGGVNERDACAADETGLEVGIQRYHDGRHQFHKAVVADEVRKLGAQLDRHVLELISHEIAEVGLVNVDYDRQDPAHAQLSASAPRR